MSFLTNAFITAIDFEGNTAKIATSKITSIEGLCGAEDYKDFLEKKENRTSIAMHNKCWYTLETPEEIVEKIYQAEVNALKELRKSRLPIQISADLFNALAAYKNEDGYNCYVSIDTISCVDDEYSNCELVTTVGKAESVDTLDDIMKSIENAKQKRIKTLRQFCVGVV